MSPGLVSILIPTYNSACYIGRTLQSAISQTYPHVEIIVHDNASTDSTRDIVQHYANKHAHVRLYSTDRNLGPLANWRLGLERCSGEFVKVLWSDDWLDSQFIELCLPPLQNDRRVGLAFSAVILHGDEFDLPYYLHVHERSIDSETYIVRTAVYDNMPVSPACAIIRRTDASFDVPHGASPELISAATSLGAGPDVLFMLNAALNSNTVAHIPRLLCHFQSRPDSFTCRHTRRVVEAYAETFSLFIRDQAAKLHPRIGRRVRTLKALRGAKRFATAASAAVMRPITQRLKSGTANRSTLEFTG